MKNSINHLPQNKQEELKKIVNTILQGCNEVEMIILFGSYARGNYKEAKDLKPDRKSGHVSDYDILVVTKTKELALSLTFWSKISEECRKLKPSADPRILTHDIKELNNKLSKGQYFYSEIKEEGIIIYDSGNFELASKRELAIEEERQIAQNEFDSWFFQANAFFENFESNLKKSLQDERYLSIAAFELHQAAEHAYKAIHLVFDNNCPQEHFLQALGCMIEEYHPDLKTLFPRDTEVNKERLRRLEYAYIGGRYDPEYYISNEDLEILQVDVKRLIEITEEICKKKILSLGTVQKTKLC